jgi:hypothetical protein
LSNKSVRYGSGKQFALSTSCSCILSTTLNSPAASPACAYHPARLTSISIDFELRASLLILSHLPFCQIVSLPFTMHGEPLSVSPPF